MLKAVLLTGSVLAGLLHTFLPRNSRNGVLQGYRDKIAKARLTSLRSPPALALPKPLACLFETFERSHVYTPIDCDGLAEPFCHVGLA